MISAGYKAPLACWKKAGLKKAGLEVSHRNLCIIEAKDLPSNL
jgi:hypothetical protein